MPEPLTGRATAADTAQARALFVRVGELVRPTELARGPWRPDALHGGAVAALLASALEVPGRTPVRVTFDLLRSVPYAPLRLVVTLPEGGERVVRQTVSLLSGNVEVATAQALAIRQVNLKLPSRPEPPDPFAGAPVPDLTHTRPKVAEMVGWTCFDSDAISARTLSAELPGNAKGIYIKLLVPVIAGEPTRSISRAAAAADYASSSLAGRMDFDSWSFMNADLTLHLSRIPADDWIGLAATGVIDPNGSGLSVAELFDPKGRLGQSIQSLVVEARTRVG
ncbi:thioesterase family protein [Nocardioides ginsengisegetis]|nr:acyl-CoA thioesterase domain-containing protein [Nocardioides ginsengisegetis]